MTYNVYDGTLNLARHSSGPEVLFQDLRRDEIHGWWWWWRTFSSWARFNVPSYTLYVILGMTQPTVSKHWKKIDP